MRRVSSTLIPRTKRIFPRECPLFSCSLPCFSFCFSFCFLPPHTSRSHTHIPQAPRPRPSLSPFAIAISHRLQLSPSVIAIGLNFGVSKPKHPLLYPSQALPWRKIAIPEPERFAGSHRWRKIGISNPICPSATPSQGPSGLKIAVFDPLRPSRWPPGLNFGVFNPICPSSTPSQATFGLKTRIPEPADPFRCRVLVLQVRSRRGIYRGSAPNPGAPHALSDFAAQSHGPGRSASPDLLNYLQLVSYVETVVYVQEEVVVGVVS